MKDWIRWPGLIVFLVFLAVLAAGYYFFAGVLIKAAVEQSGTELVGARVELDQADVTLSPLGVELHNLQVTSSEDPMVNALQVGRIRFHMDGSALLRRKFIINEMDVEKVRLNTPRTTSGKIIEKPVKEAEKETVGPFDFAMPSIELPDVKDILAREELDSERLAEQARLDIESSTQKWDSKKTELPDKSVFDAHAERLKTIEPVRTGDKLKDLKALSDAIDNLKTINQNIKTDFDKLVNAEKELRQDIDLMKSNIKAVSKAPSSDITRLKQKYSPTSSGVTNISNLLFGETAARWTGIALDWYERLGPVLLKAREASDTKEKPLPRHKGIDIHFKEQNPLPGFLIQSARVSLALAADNIMGEVKDITSDQTLLGRPLVFMFEGDKMEKMQKIKISGNFNHIKQNESMDVIGLSLSGYQLSDFVVSRGKSFPLSLDSAVMTMSLEGRLQQGKLNASLNSKFRSAKFTLLEDKETGKLVKAVGNALKNVNSFDVNAELRGTLREHNIKIRSDLDDVVKNALGEQFKQKSQQFEKQLKDQVEQKTQVLTAKLESRMDELNSVKNDFDERRKHALEKIQLAESRLDALKNEKESELKSKSQKKLDKLRGILR